MARKRTRSRSSWGTVRQRRGRWTAQYTGPDGDRHAAGISFSDENSARAWLRDERRLIDLDTWTPPAARRAKAEISAVTVGQWLTHFHDTLETGVKPLRRSTMQNYRRVVRVRITEPHGPGANNPDVCRLADIPLGELTKQDVYRWWDAVQAVYSEGGHTVSQQAYKRLKAALADAVRRELIPTNPVDIKGAGTAPKPKETYLPEDWEITAVLDAVPKQYAALTSLCLHHGLRIGEALAVELGDVRLAEHDTPGPWLPRVTVTVKQNAQRITDGGSNHMEVQPPKSEAGFRDVPIMAVDVPLFLRHLTKYAPTKPTMLRTARGTRHAVLLTVTRTGEMLMDTSYRNVLERAVKAASVNKGIKPHSGRRWLITRLAERGAHLKEIGRLLGQDDVSTILDVYMKVRAGRTVSLMDEVNNTLEGRNDG